MERTEKLQNIIIIIIIIIFWGGVCICFEITLCNLNIILF